MDKPLMVDIHSDLVHGREIALVARDPDSRLSGTAWFKIEIQTERGPWTRFQTITQKPDEHPFDAYLRACEAHGRARRHVKAGVYG